MVLPYPVSHTCYVPSLFIPFDLITRTMFGEVYRAQTPSFCSFSTPLLEPNIFLSALLSNALSLRSPLNVRPSYVYGTCLPNMYFFSVIPVQGTLLDMLFWLLLLSSATVLLFSTQLAYVSLLGSPFLVINFHLLGVLLPVKQFVTEHV
jgi:hypothetical protein